MHIFKQIKEVAVKKKKSLILLILVVFICFSTWHLFARLLLPKDMQEENTYHDAIIQEEEGRSVHAGTGDPGLTEQELRTPAAGKTRDRTRNALAELLLEYDGYVPYLKDGRLWQETIPKLDHGVDNWNGNLADGYGVDSLGYVLWAYYQLFHIAIPNPAEAYRNGNRIPVDGLLTGDVGMEEYQEGIPNHYGIFIGYDDEIPVFAHCTSIPYPGYPGGVSRLSSIGDKYYMGTAPATFQYFTRPDVEWENAGGNYDGITAHLYGMQTDEIPASNMYGDYGTAVFRLIKARDYNTLIGMLNLGIMEQKGYILERKKFIEKMEILAEVFANKGIMIYNTIRLDDTSTVVRFCIADESSSGGERTWDILHCLWLDITYYSGMDNESASFLPFHEGSIAAAAEFGFERE